MKMRLLKLLTLGWIVPLLLLGGCSSTPTKDEDRARAGASVETRGSGDAASGDEDGTGAHGRHRRGGADDENADKEGNGSGRGHGAWTGDPLDEPGSALATRTILFEFDSSEIRADFLDILRAHAHYLTAHPTVRVTLEGHADERGTREYNLALGERRAHAVKQFLTAEGVDGGQLREISYGEERPVDTSQSEDAWSRNRRVELAY
jgi:peptidoglycan-associated lipoprotein